MRENCGAFGHSCSQTARMIEVGVGVDDESNWLVGDCLLRGGHDAGAPGVVLSALDDQNVIAHVDCKGCVVPTNLEDPIAEFFYGRRPPCLLSTSTTASRGRAARRGATSRGSASPSGWRSTWCS